MRKTLLFGLLALMLNTTAYAGYQNVEFANYRSNQKVPVASSMVLDADFVVATLHFSSNTSSIEQRTLELKSFIDSIKKQASSIQGLELGEELVSISPTEKSKSVNASRSYVNIYFMLDENSDIYDATQSMYALTHEIKVPRGVTYSLSNTNLAIRDPQQYREKLLTMIKDEIQSTKNVLGDDYKVSISGLEKPVVVQKKNERQVVLFIDYKLQMAQ